MGRQTESNCSGQVTGGAPFFAVLALTLVVGAFSTDVLAQRGRPGGARPAEIHESFKPGRDFGERGAVEERRGEAARYEQLLQARENHKNLQLNTVEEAHAWMGRLSDPFFMAHVNGLDAEEIARIGIEKQPSLQTEAEALVWALKLPELIPVYRQKYRAYIDAKIEANTREFVRNLPAGAAQYLVEFARSNGARETDPAKLSTRVVDRWIKSVRAEQKALSLAFPLSDAPGSKDDPRRSLSGITDIVGRGSDAHEHRYARAAFNDYIAASPRLSRLGLERWSFRADDMHDLWGVLKRLEDPLPGDEPEVVFFLDRAVANAPIAEMSKAWTDKSRTEPRLLTHEDIDLFLSEFAGRTLILVGHIERRQFVQERGGGRPPLKMDIPTLIEAAERKRVFLVPIGCNSAKEGAYFGFTRPILSNEVADLLKAIPSGRPSVGDLLAAFSVIGSISVDAASFRQFLEVTVHKPVTEGDKTYQAPFMVARIPAAPPGTSVPATFTAYQSEWEAAHRPLLDRGLLAVWRACYRDSPILTLLLSGLGISLAPLGWDWVRTRVIRRRNLVSRRERNVITAVVVTGVVFLAAAVMRFVIVGWPILLWLAGGVIVLMLYEMVFGSDSGKGKEHA